MQFGVIGDIHGYWDAFDTAFFNAAGYDMLLFVGDFARVTADRGVARRLSRLTAPAFAIPGNHDGTTLPHLLGEIRDSPVLKRLGGLGMKRRVRALARAMAPVRLGGYSLHTLDDGLGLIIARPHAMGGDRLYYRHYLRVQFGVAEFAASAAKLERLVDAAPRDLVILAHNGPAGLGDALDSPFGCDFAPKQGDFGDPDLRRAIDYAKGRGHRVRAVLAGHMHHRSKHTGTWRRAAVEDGDTLVVNAARVPRIQAGGARRHHIALQVNANGVGAETVWVNNDGDVVERTPLTPEPATQG